jgi:hypothetical protein
LAKQTSPARGAIRYDARRMRGANKSFIDDPERFAARNVILSPKIQTYLTGKWINEGVDNATIQTRLPGVYDFDLLPYEAENFFDGTNKRVKAYLLSLIEMRPLATVKSSLADSIKDSRSLSDLKTAFTVKNRSLDMSKHKVTAKTTRIRAFYVPWDNNRTWTMQLDDSADFCFTPTLDGCSVVVGSGTNPTISHLNYQHVQNGQTVVDQGKIDREIFKTFGLGTRKALRKDDYSDDAQKRLGTNFYVTVIGIRDTTSNTWDFYYQRRLSSIATDKKGTSFVKNVLADRLVPIT